MDFNICKMVLLELNQLIKHRQTRKLNLYYHYVLVKKKTPKNSQVPPFANWNWAVRDLLHENAFKKNKQRWDCVCA